MALVSTAGTGPPTTAREPIPASGDVRTTRLHRGNRSRVVARRVLHRVYVVRQRKRRYLDAAAAGRRGGPDHVVSCARPAAGLVARRHAPGLPIRARWWRALRRLALIATRRARR